jgi:putative hemolysin
MTELSHIQNKVKTWNHFELEVIDMDGIKIDKVLVKALR